MPETAPARLLQQANGVMSIARCLAFPVGAAVGGAIVATVGRVTALQSVLLAAHAPIATIGTAAALSGFAFSFGTVIWETSLQRTIVPEKLARVSADNWMEAMAFLPAGYAIAGPVASVIGTSVTLVAGAVWIVVSTLAVASLPDVRNFRLRELRPQRDPELAAAATT